MVFFFKQEACLTSESDKFKEYCESGSKLDPYLGTNFVDPDPYSKYESRFTH